VNHIGKWDGSSWSGLGSGINVGVSVLGVFDDGEGAALYAGGAFTGAGGIPVGHIAKWDGTSWSSLAGGTNGSEVMALAVFDDGTGPALYAGGDFTFAGGNAANRIAMWNGSSWSFLGNGMDGDVLALTVFDDGQGPALHAGGSFTSAGGIDASYIAKWDGSTWSALSGMSHPVRALAVFDDGSGPALFAGGDFTGAGGLTANYIARWNGKSWSALASGMNANVRAFAVHDDGTGGGPALFVGGAFTTSASGDSYLAKWGCEAPSPTTFCTAKTALVCGAANISATGTPSATSSNGFVVGAQPVRGCRAGLLLHSDQPVQPGVAFGGPGNGLLCLTPAGLRRAGPIDSGGTSPTACDGMFVIDLNSFASLGWTATGCNPAPGQNNPTGFLSTPGTTVNAQMWGRDSVITGQVLSDGISWVVGP
jgi:hypothetical protein